MKRGVMILVLFAAWSLTACGPSAGQTASTIPVFETGVDPEAWALVPAGEFYEGQFAHEVTMDHDYEMMVTPVTNAQYAAYLNDALHEGWVKRIQGQVVGYYPGDVFRAYRHEFPIEAGDWLHVPLDEPGLRIIEQGGSFEAKPEYANHPMVHVTWFGAKAFCEFYGWRLPTELEWERAARGDDDRPYPWGKDIGPGNANYYHSDDPFESIYGKQGDTTPVGFYNGGTYGGFETQDSPSPYGLYDMAGNVWQWMGNVYEYQHYRYMRGGSRMEYEPYLRVWARNNAGPDFHSSSVGFRCVRDLSE